MRLDDRLDNAEPETATARRAREPLIGLIKPSKYVLRFARRKTDAVVRDGKADIPVACLNAKDDMLRFAGVFPCITNTPLIEPS